MLRNLQAFNENTGSRQKEPPSLVIAQHEDGALHAVVIADTISADCPPSNTVFDYLAYLNAYQLLPHVQAGSKGEGQRKGGTQC